MTIKEALRRLITPDDDGPEEPEARLAIYDSSRAAPRVVSFTADDLEAFIGELTAQTYNYSHERGGRIPFIVIREVVENLIHAYFRNAVITILNDGNTIRIADQGPGIRDKDRALQPGFTTATREMRRFIRGVGSGLPVAREQLAFLGGTLEVEDNLEHGTVVTLSLDRDEAPEVTPAEPRSRPTVGRRRRDLSARQKKVLLLIGELGAAGPTTIAKELDISHSTAYRELQALERMALVQARGGGRRTLTEEGIGCLTEIFS